MNYHIAESNEYIVITGAGIEGVKVCKKTMSWPGQSVSRFTMAPVSYSVNLESMSLEKLEFMLPVVFTIGPKDEPLALEIYARLLTDQQNLQDMVMGILEGETRAVAASMAIEEIFSKRKLFKEMIVSNIGAELAVFGMFIYNANVKDLHDMPGSEYFKVDFIGAINQAKVDVANARMMGSVGEKNFDGETRKMFSKVETETNTVEQAKQIEVSRAKAALSTMQAEFDRDVDIAKIENENRAKSKYEELELQLEIQLAIVGQERERAERVSKAIVDAEVVQALADAQLYRSKALADAKLYLEMQMAEGDRVMYDAQSCGITLLHKAFHEDTYTTLRYIMMEQGLHKDLANINLKALDCLNPTMRTWVDSEPKDAKFKSKPKGGE